MSAAAVQTEILDPMQRLFLPPRQMGTGEQSAALREYVKGLQGFDGPDLAQAWERVRDSHPNRSWPLLSVFIGAAREARKERVPMQQVGRYSGQENYEQNRLHWEEVRRSPLARDAVQHSVSWSMKCLIMSGKKAHEIDLARLQREKASAERTAHKIRTGQPIEWKGGVLNFTPENATLALSMWDAQMKTEAATQREVMAYQRSAA